LSIRGDVFRRLLHRTVGIRASIGHQKVHPSPRTSLSFRTAPDRDICNDERVARAIVRTVVGFRWHRFKEIVCERAGKINCVTQSDAIVIAFKLRETRIFRPVHILPALKYSPLWERLTEMYPRQEDDGNTITSFCEMTDFRNCHPQALKLARRSFCNHDKIANFLIRCELSFERDSRVMRNADETE
jgi:hypothetical protein